MAITKIGRYTIKVMRKGEGILPDFRGDAQWGYTWNNDDDPGDYGYATDFKTKEAAMKDAVESVQKWHWRAT